MTLRERLEAIVAALPPDSAVTLSVDVLRDWLSSDDATENAQDSRNSAVVTGVDFTVAQVAEMLSRGESTIRTWIGEGHFPNAYRLRGREWRIPMSDLAALQRAESQRYRTPAQPSRSSRSSGLSAWRDY